VVDLDPALGQQLLDIAIRESVAQVSADRDRDHLRREPEAGERRPVGIRAGGSRSTHPASVLGPGSTAAAGAQANATDPNEIGHVFALLVIHQARDPPPAARRRHRHRARTSHYQRQATRQP
jgi:hypothetical protein